VNNTLAVKDNDKHALDFALHLSRHFPVCDIGLLVFGSCSFSPNAAGLIIASVFVTLFPRFAQNLMNTRYRIHYEITSDLIKRL
jgi:hypothetical protein